MIACKLCNQNVQVPVKPLIACYYADFNDVPCNNIYCLGCLRKYFQLNEPKSSRVNVKCPQCNDTIIKCSNWNAKTAYFVDTVMIETMGGSTKCRRCDTDCLTQMGIWKHLKGETSNESFGPCPKSTTSCNKCHKSFIREDEPWHKCGAKLVQPKEIYVDYKEIFSMRIMEITYTNNYKHDDKTYEGYKLVTDSNHIIFFGVKISYDNTYCRVIKDSSSDGDIYSMVGETITAILWNPKVTEENNETAFLQICGEDADSTLKIKCGINGEFYNRVLLKCFDKIMS